MKERPPMLAQLGAELDRVAARELAPRAHDRTRTTRAAIAAALIVVLLAACATAAVLISQGAPLAAVPAADLAPWADPLSGSVHLAGLDAPDPGGGLPWDIRLSRSRTGETCTAVGQIYRGQFGILGLDGVFRAQPVGGVDLCGVPGIAGPVLAGARVFVGDTPGQARTVVNGVAGAGTRSVTAYGPGGPRRLRLGPDGSFITVYAGYVEDVRPRIVIVDARGRSHSVAFASSPLFEAEDPGGGAPWTVAGYPYNPIAAGREAFCVQASEEAARTDVSFALANQPLVASAPPACEGPHDATLYVYMHRFDPDDPGWTNTDTPSRTLVYGAASRDVAALHLLVAGAAQKLPIDPNGRAFLAVLDGHVDPRTLRLVATLTDGRRVAYGRSNAVDGAGRPLDQSVEPYRAAAREPAVSGNLAAFGLRLSPLTATVHATVRAANPAGGPAWFLRSWRAHVRIAGSFEGSSRQPRTVVCWQIGVNRAGRLVDPVAGAGAQPLRVSVSAPGAPGTTCSPPAASAHEPDPPDVTTYVTNPYAYSAKPARTVVAGLLGPGMRDPVLLGAGPSRPLAVDRNGVYMTVLPGRYWLAPLRLRVTERGGRTASSTVVAAQRGFAPEVRAPDPDGGPAWGYYAGADCPAHPYLTRLGRVVDRRLVYIDPASGLMVPGATEGTSGSSPCRYDLPAQPRNPVVAATVMFEADVFFPSAHTRTEAEIERRTQPGYTAIAGSAGRSVVSITLTTPSDVRTVRPTGRDGDFLAVYDGIFYRGSVTVTVLLRNGRTYTESVPDAVWNTVPPQ